MSRVVSKRYNMRELNRVLNAGVEWILSLSVQFETKTDNLSTAKWDGAIFLEIHILDTVVDNWWTERWDISKLVDYIHKGYSYES